MCLSECMVGSFLYLNTETFNFEGDILPCLAVLVLLFVVMITIMCSIFANMYWVYLLLLSFTTENKD